MSDIKPLKNAEYQGLRAMFGMVSMMETASDSLKDRMRMCKAWKWYRLAQVALNKVTDAVLVTIPPQKLKSISKDLKFVKIEIYVGGVTGKPPHDKYFYVGEDNYNVVVEAACSNECQFCTKCGAAAKQCKLRKALIGSIPWDLKTLDEDGHCRLSGETSIGMSEEELPQCETAEDMEEEWSE